MCRCICTNMCLCVLCVWGRMFLWMWTCVSACVCVPVYHCVCVCGLYTGVTMSYMESAGLWRLAQPNYKSTLNKCMHPLGIRYQASWRLVNDVLLLRLGDHIFPLAPSVSHPMRGRTAFNGQPSRRCLRTRHLLQFLWRHHLPWFTAIMKFKRTFLVAYIENLSSFFCSFVTLSLIYICLINTRKHLFSSNNIMFSESLFPKLSRPSLVSRACVLQVLPDVVKRKTPWKVCLVNV